MRLFSLILALFLFLCPNCWAGDGKEIHIWQKWQFGGAYKDGILVHEFEVMTGDDEDPTPTGTFRILEKFIDYYSKRHKAQMPYSMFFTRTRHGIHARTLEYGFPSAEVRSGYASRGCVSTDAAKWLFEWAPLGTKVIIHEERDDYW